MSETTLQALEKIVERDFPPSQVAHMKGFCRSLLDRSPTEDKHRDAPVRKTCALIGDKWSSLVVLFLHAGTMRYSTLQRLASTFSHEGGETGISQRMLTRTLRVLEEDGFVARRILPAVPPHVEYSLTPLGESFHEQIINVIQWAERHTPEIMQARTAFKAIEPVE
ncbi:MAG: helix-turn-helix domain-containing protein [Steroidobacteraceae bacterium]